VPTQPHLLLEFAKHRLFGCLAVVDTALRELPGILPYPSTPEKLPLIIAKYDADVRSIPF
jgi:hypothetical protein